MVGTPGYRSKAISNLVVSRNDALEITQALRVVWPALRITWYELGKAYYDEESYYQRCYQWTECGGAERGEPEPQRDVRDPRGEPFPYFESFAVPEPHNFSAWMEPPNWKPRWTADKNRWGFYELLNPPLHRFRFLRGVFGATGDRGPGNHLYADAPEPLDPHEPIFLYRGLVSAIWPNEDKAAKAFVEKVFRIIGRLTTDRFISVGPNLKARSAEPFRSGGFYYRAGKDACAWALERRHNYLQDRWKPGNYPFRADEIYTPEELAAEQASNVALKAEIEARVAAEFEARRIRQPKASRG